MQDFDPKSGTNARYILIQKTDWDYLILGDVAVWAY
jgi:hypothetical protein